MRLSVLWRTLTVTRNPFLPLILKRSGGRKAVIFRNRQTYQLTWSQFRVFRDNYPCLAKHNVTQVEDDLFGISDERSEVLSKSELLPMLFDLMQDFAVHEQEGVYHLKNEKIELYGSLAMLSCMRELRTGEYEYDYKDKVVLDVGGFEGESAAYFWQKGARKIIVYEPVPTHVEVLKKNMALNHIEAEVHQSGIGKEDGTQSIQYEETDPGFGILNNGLKKLEIQTTQASRIIAESSADIAKFDCEGGEQFLIDVSTETLRKIGYYIIEVHSPQIRTAVLQKFVDAGFALEKDIPKPPTMFSVLWLKRI